MHFESGQDSTYFLIMINDNSSCTIREKIPAVLCVFLLLTVGVALALPFRDGDIWFHLLYAQQFIENRTFVPDHSLYSWSPTEATQIYVTWLSDLLLYLVFNLGGDYGLYIFRYVCAFFVLGLGFFEARRYGVLTSPYSWLIFILSFLISDAAFFCKPEIFSYVFMALFSWGWWRIKNAPAGKSGNICYLFPLITLVWVNSHGGVIFGIFFLFLVFLAEVFNGLFGYKPLDQEIRRTLFISILLSFLCLFINPYFYNYPLHLFKEITNAGNLGNLFSPIEAFQSPFKGRNPQLDFGDLINISMILWLYIVVPKIRKKLVDLSVVVVVGCFIVLFTVYMRTTFYLGPILMFSLLPLVPKNEENPRFELYRRDICIPLILFFLISFKATYDRVYLPRNNEHFGFGKGYASPFSAAEFIKSNYPNKDLGTTYGTGAYLAWALWPNSRVMIDARQFPFRLWFSEYIDFTRDPFANSSFMERFASDIWCVSIHQTTLVSAFISSPNWEIVFWGPNSIVFVKKDILKASASVDIRIEEILNMKNPSALARSANVAIVKKDWEMTEKILERMLELKKLPQARNIYTNVSLYRDVLQEYYASNYKNVIELIENHNDEMERLSGLKIVLANSYLFLGDYLWSSNHDKNAALAMFEKSYNVIPSSYALFNMAISLYSIGEETFLQQKILEDFLKTNLQRVDSEAQRSRRIAQEILSDKATTIFIKPFMPHKEFGQKPDF